jgi:non-specific serine/threonine protein kinase
VLRRYRRAAGLTHEALAEAAGLSARTISDLERGVSAAPRPGTLALLAEALGLPPAGRAALEAAAQRPAEHAAGAGPRHNLPAQLTSFVGRARELDAVRTLLAAARLVTLTGTGGVGKTRLGLQAAAEVAQAYPDGACFVDLAPLPDAALLPGAVLAALGLQETPGRPVLAALVEHLRGRGLLLVLDNCEHLVDACARVVDTLLRGCPRLTVLVTSREMLSVPGEAAWRVPSLSLPDAPDAASVDSLGRSEAVHLFVERARLVQPDFALTAANAAAVLQVCQRLDGIPLALELAAARVRVLPGEQVAARLDDRFRLLTGGSRTALRRQQTLKALVDWSHDLLSGAERAVLRRLAVFSGGWTLDAAEAVCSGDGIEPTEILDVLTALVDKSLVQAEAHEGDERYRLLETIRQYAEDKLLDAGEAAAVRARHRDLYLALAERAASELLGRGQRRWYRRLAADHDNLRAAIGWCRADPAGAEPELRLAAALARFWRIQGHLREGGERLAAALERARGTPTPARAAALNWSGHFASLLGDLPRARATGEEAVRVARAVGDPALLAFALRHLADYLRMLGRVEDARPVLEEALATARGCGDRREAAFSLATLGLVVDALGDHDRGRALLEDGLASAREVGDGVPIAGSLMWLGALALRRGDVEPARTLFEEALTVMQSIGGQGVRQMPLMGLGDVARRAGDDEAARARYHEALRVASDARSDGSVTAILTRLAGAETRLGRPRRAARLLG